MHDGGIADFLRAEIGIELEAELTGVPAVRKMMRAGCGGRSLMNAPSVILFDGEQVGIKQALTLSWHLHNCISFSSRHWTMVARLSLTVP